MASITIQVDEEIKIAFEKADPNTQNQLSSVVNFFFRENLPQKSLTEVMAEISDRAQRRGLTLEILQNILAEND